MNNRIYLKYKMNCFYKWKRSSGFQISINSKYRVRMIIYNKRPKDRNWRIKNQRTYRHKAINQLMN